MPSPKLTVAFDDQPTNTRGSFWITQALSERDAIVLVSGDGRDIAGYFSLHALSAPQCRVGLVAVGAASQGQGVGRALMTAALQSAAQHGVSEISVVTQGTSNGAVRYYESAGFRPDRRQIWYHHWLPESVRDARD